MYTATLHHQRGHAQSLYLVAALNVPQELISQISVIPYGRGMAGFAQSKRAPAYTCDLHTQPHASLSPNAFSVGDHGTTPLQAGAYPLIDHQGELIGVLGLSCDQTQKSRDLLFSRDVLNRLQDEALSLLKTLKDQSHSS